MKPAAALIAAFLRTQLQHVAAMYVVLLASEVSRQGMFLDSRRVTIHADEEAKASVVERTDH